jgi:hypothetical protein
VSKQQSRKSETNISRCTVRECDETEQGKFIAYVDEKNDSYDVSINLDAENNLTAYSCDCGSEKICNHVQALLNHVTTKQPKKSQVPGAKRKGLQSVLDNADPDEIKAWLWQLISSNEEVKLLFVNEFNRPAHYDADKVNELVGSTRKAILGNDVSPTPTLVTRMAKSLVAVQKPVVQFYLEAPFEKEHCAGIKRMLECLDELAQDIDADILIRNYTGLLSPIAAALRKLNDEGSFHRAFGHLISGLKLNKPSGVCIMEVLSLLIKTTSFNRAHSLISELADIFDRYYDQDNRFIKLTGKLYYDCLSSYNLLLEFGPHLPVGSLDQQTNKKILQHLIDSKNLEIASQRLWMMYENAVNPEEKIELLQQLKSINIQLEDEAEILKVLQILVPMNYEYEDFALLQRYLSPEKLARLRQHMIDDASAELHKNPTKFRFTFLLFQAENDYESILRFLDKTTTYEIIEPSFRSLVAYDSKTLMQQMFRIVDKLGPDSDYNANNSEFESVKQLVKVTLKLYPEEDLRLAIKENTRTWGAQHSMNYYTTMLRDTIQD